MIRIIQKRAYAYIFSILLTLVSLGAIAHWGLKYGLDFKGGTLVEVAFSEAVAAPKAPEIEEVLRELSLSSLTVQPTGERGAILRYLSSDDTTNDKVMTKLRTLDKDLTLLRTDFVGASVSGDMKKNALLGTALAILGIAGYIAYAFRRVARPVASWEYGIGAVIALTHDIIVTIGLFAFLGHYHGVEVGVPFVAALLTILGYSVNDTIVVYDRIRENLLKSRKDENFEEVVNRSLNETLGRSINTSLTVIIVLIAMVLFGGEGVKWFSVALLAGVAFGTYSSIYIASALLVSRYYMKYPKSEVVRKSIQ